MDQNIKKQSFRVLLVITTPKLSEKATALFSEENIPVHYKLNAIGTASSEMLDILGLGTPDKSILISMMPKDFSDRLLRKLYTELMFGVPGNGIAFTLPLTGTNNRLLKMLMHMDEDDSKNERKEEIIMSEIKRVMIAAVVNSGYTEEVMNAARDAGARGGTVIHSRGVADENATSVWGLGVQEEKEIVIIVADTESKLGIMQSISSKCGVNTEAKGLVVSLPIDTVIGLGNSI